MSNNIGELFSKLTLKEDHQKQGEELLFELKKDFKYASGHVLGGEYGIDILGHNMAIFISTERDQIQFSLSFLYPEGENIGYLRTKSTKSFTDMNALLREIKQNFFKD